MDNVVSMLNKFHVIDLAPTQHGTTATNNSKVFSSLANSMAILEKSDIGPLSAFVGFSNGVCYLPWCASIGSWCR